jgi:hypothetical protein
VTDLAPLTHCTSLQLLTCTNTAVHHLPLFTQTALQLLDVRNTPLQEFTPLLEVPTLKAIWVSDPALLPPALAEKVVVNPPLNIWLYWHEL